ncbi:hypothetical protein Leryth_010000 [Lithospermum erythrorhizon]|uniref:Hyccin n=1 Tax=Lithospermum erythrorhizon TaxID=34254 RepID=A0AAV3R2L0_LITER|nr:hypothetical protein Leryth_010000 [Lithospermum erythrorhizon]
MSIGEDEASSSRTSPKSPHISWSDSYTKAHEAIKSLSPIVSSIPPALSSSETPASCLLNNQDIATQISTLLRHPDSGSGDNRLCRWLYDTFQTNEPDLHLVVLRFLPILAGVYLSRAALHKPLAGFECVLLALYAHETASRKGQALTVSIPDLSHPSVYHESKQNPKNSATELNIAIISPSLEPYGTVRSTRRARIVGVALEFYYTKITQIPIRSKIEFCEFCKIWAGQHGDSYKNYDDHDGEIQEQGKKQGRILLPWELLQPILRIVGHCLMGPSNDEELFETACGACRSLYERALHEINPKAILATESLFKLAKITRNSRDIDHTEIEHTKVIAI